jgi:hypothetical protein
MQEKLFDLFLRQQSIRYVFTLITVAFPIGISLAWLGAAYIEIIWGDDPWVTFTKLWLFGFPTFFVALAFGFILERGVLKNRPNNSWRWVLVRMFGYLMLGIPCGNVLLWGMRTGVREFPPLVESIYWVQSFAMAILLGVLFTLIELAVAELQRRENRLQTQIQALQIQIDETRRKKQVAEIAETDFFQDLQQKAHRIRETRGKPK